MEYLKNISLPEFKNIFDAVGTTSSILSLIISIFVLISIRKIRQFYVFNARVPEITKKLSKLASDLSNSLNSFNGLSSKINKTLVDTEISMKSLRKKVRGDARKEIKIIIKDLKNLNNSNSKSFRNIFSDSNNDLSDTDTQKEYLERIHLSIYKIIAECDDAYEESRWER